MKITIRISVICIILYTLLLIYLMILGRGFTNSVYMYNLIPFHTIKNYLQFDRFNTNIWAINLIGNICIFVPFGILLPIIMGGRYKKSFFTFLSIIIILELLQLFTRRGCFDVDDIILNSLGFLIGYAAFKVIGLLISPHIKSK